MTEREPHGGAQYNMRTRRDHGMTEREPHGGAQNINTPRDNGTTEIPHGGAPHAITPRDHGMNAAPYGGAQQAETPRQGKTETPLLMESEIMTLLMEECRRLINKRPLVKCPPMKIISGNQEP